MADIRKLNTADADFQQRLDALLVWDSVSDDAVNKVIADIVTGRARVSEREGREGAKDTKGIRCSDLSVSVTSLRPLSLCVL